MMSIQSQRVVKRVGIVGVMSLALGSGVVMGKEPEKSDRQKSPAHDGRYNVTIVAHRGASHAAPENTLPAVRLAFEEGADFVEGDYWLTRDEQIVCLHDEDTRRTAPKQPNRRVQESTLAELRSLDVGAWKDGKFAG